MRKVLVIDELTTISKVYFDLFYKNFDVEATVDAGEILPRIERFKPGVIVLNTALEGFEPEGFCSTVKKKYNIPTILLQKKDAAQTITINSCKADAVITQPYVTEELLHLVEQLMVMKG